MRFVLAPVAVLRLVVVFEVDLPPVDAFEDDLRLTAGFEVASTSCDAWGVVSSNSTVGVAAVSSSNAGAEVAPLGGSSWD